MATKTTKTTKATKSTTAEAKVVKTLARKAKPEATPQAVAVAEPAAPAPKAKPEATPTWARCRIQLDGVGSRAFARWAGAAGWANNEIAEYLNERGAGIPSKSVWFYAREGRGTEGAHGVGKRDGSFPAAAVARWTKDREAVRARLASKAKAEPKAE